MSLAPGLVRTTSSRLLTRANEPDLKSQSESAYRVVKQRKVGAPDTIRTCDLCLRRANAHGPNPEATHLINRKNGVLQAGNDATACLLTPRYVALRNRAMALS